MKYDKMFNHMSGLPTDTKIDFHDILIQPAPITDIVSRSEVNPFIDNTLPLFAAPMDTVVHRHNVNIFLTNHIKVCLPRGEKMMSLYSNVFSSVSLDDFIKEYITKGGIAYTKAFVEYDNEKRFFVLIDIANGHMKKMETAIKQAKELYGNRIVIMAGNVAHPETYRILSEAGADYVRIGIGNGNGCLTTEQTGVGYPMASLIRECYYKSLLMENPAFIVADGGMKSYSDIIKAIALGAHYVMVGSLFNKALDSAGPTYLFNKIKIDQYGFLAHIAYKNKWTLTKKFRGMSTKEVQKDWGADKIKTSEGVVRFRPVEYTIGQWKDNFESYLRSAMSYSNARTLDEFRGEANINVISQNAFKRFNK